MHLIFENLVPNLVRHYTGDFKGLGAGSEAYELPKNVWEAIADATAQSGDTTPSEFGARMPNICTERSNMTAETWSIWITYLGPILMQDQFSKPVYYEHFSKLSRLVRLCMSYEMKRSDIELIRNGFIEWVQEYEKCAPPANNSVYSDKNCATGYSINTIHQDYQRVLFQSMHSSTSRMGLNPPVPCGATGRSQWNVSVARSVNMSRTVAIRMPALTEGCGTSPNFKW